MIGSKTRVVQGRLTVPMVPGSRKLDREVVTGRLGPVVKSFSVAPRNHLRLARVILRRERNDGKTRE